MCATEGRFRYPAYSPALTTIKYASSSKYTQALWTMSTREMYVVGRFINTPDYTGWTPKAKRRLRSPLHLAFLWSCPTGPSPLSPRITCLCISYHTACHQHPHGQAGPLWSVDTVDPVQGLSSTTTTAALWHDMSTPFARASTLPSRRRSLIWFTVLKQPLAGRCTFLMSFIPIESGEFSHTAPKNGWLIGEVLYSCTQGSPIPTIQCYLVIYATQCALTY
ncbi:hypothetical protein EDC04DRAFT_1857879 [Pisolithus marmoratus]|nr:hypothetical protein EDC04DRAFT_1857879 [Pisolithus marmoratus]